MAISIHGPQAAQKGYPATSSNGEARWYIDYLGGPVQAVSDAPQCNLIEMGAGQTIVPHFHAVDQFQIFVQGSGSLGRHQLAMLALHYTDHHTAYGPIHAGPGGLALFTLRAQSDPGAIYIDKPGYREHLRPSPRRYLIGENLALSVPTVMQRRAEPVFESVLPADADTRDGLGADMLRLGAGQRWCAPDPAAGGGQYFLVLQGSLSHEGTDWPLHSLTFVARNEPALEVQAGPASLEALVLRFPGAASPGH